MLIKRRNFLKQSFASAVGITAAAMFPEDLFGRGIQSTSHPEEIILKPEMRTGPKDSIRFSVIGLNHSHIYGMVSSLIGGGGELIMVYSREPDLLKTFTKTFPGVKVARSEEEILADNTIRLVYIETRKYIDITGREGGNHLFLVNQKETKYYNCSNVYAPYGEQLVSDVVNRTETAMTQDHCFLATELALTAQKMAHKLNV